MQKQTSFVAQVVVLVALSAQLGGCFGGGNSGAASSGDSNKAAALALTEAISFENGKLVPGLMPAADATGVSLFPLTSQAVSAGDSTLLSFDLDNPDDKNGVLMSLVQFDGASQHFEIDSKAADAGAAASGKGSDAGADDGGAAGGTHTGYFALSYKVGAKVCKKLCSKTYAIGVVEAVKLADGKVSTHAKGAILLDCTKDGDPKQCSKGEKGGGGGGSGFQNYCDGGPVSAAGPGMTSSSAGCGSCMMKQCNAEAETTYGKNWASGDFSGGSCGAFFSCSITCCSDVACTQGCATKLTATCEKDITPLDSCVSMFCADTCGSSTSTGDASVPPITATCADLANCCKAATFPASNVSACDSVVASGDAATCSSAYQAFMSVGYCG